jgi:transcriptional regulator with XRE-family HTH domain
MATRTRKIRDYEDYRERSGWWLAAWRDHANLTLDDLAGSLGRSRGYISDLETGAIRPGRPATRFNRDLVEQISKAVGTTGGRLIDVNPFTMWEHAERLSETVSQLRDEDRTMILEMAERLASKVDAA